MRARTVLVPLLLALAGAAACGTSDRIQGFEESPAPTNPEATKNADPPLGEGLPPSSLMDVTVSGTVYAPNGWLPMARTLVYLTGSAPAPLPEGVYCDECVTLDAGTFAISKSDGKVDIATKLPLGDVWLVVQKGNFRRARKFRVEKAGPIEITKDDLTLPGSTDPSQNDVIPKMAVLAGQSDDIGASLKKLGITQFDKKTRVLAADRTALMKYQVVFLPCDNATDPQMKQAVFDNLNAFVAAGGRLYVTDWSYEFVRQPFPGFITWDKETPELGSAALQTMSWDAPAKAVDTGLEDWLGATGHPTFEVEDNWVKIAGVHTLPGLDPKGATVDVTPKVWVTATYQSKTLPTTVSFPNKCGRVLYSTYHTEDDFGVELHAQEKALLYVLLEIGVCVGSETGVN